MVRIWQLDRAITQIRRLKQSLIYFFGRIFENHALGWKLRDAVGYSLLGDCLNTTVTVAATLQNTVVEYVALTLTYLLLVGITAQAIEICSFWWIVRCATRECAPKLIDC